MAVNSLGDFVLLPVLAILLVSLAKYRIRTNLKEEMFILAYSSLG